LRLEEEQRKEREQIEADRRLAVCSFSSLVWLPVMLYFALK